MGNRAISVENVRYGTESEAAIGCPAVIVLNLFYSGLGIARQMSGSGVRVVGLSAHPRIYGNFTRSCEVRVAPNSQEQPEQLAEFLLRMASELGGAIVFPTRDADLLFLDRFRGDLGPFFRLAVPLPRVLRRIIDKAALAEAAIEAGIPVPRTVVVRDRAQLQSAAARVGFPCVVKPVSSAHWREGNNWNVVGGRKAFRADNLAGLQQEYERISQARSEVLLQEWVPGDTDQIVVWGGYVRRGAGPLAYFTARKIVQSPDDFGTGCVVESERIPDLLEASVRLCDALDYEGIAEIEYKRDARDGTFKLIELNARHWDWHRLGSASQVNLTWTAYCHLAGRPVEPVHPPVRRAKWIAEDAFLTYVLASLYAGEFHPWQVRSALKGDRIYGIFAWNDPLPFIRYSAATLLPAVARAAIRKIRHRLTRNKTRLQGALSAESH